MKKLSVGVLSGVIASFSVPVNAGLLVDPIGKNYAGSFQSGVNYSSATTVYVFESDEKADIDVVRNGITFYGVKGFSEKIDLYAGVTYNMTTEIDKIGSENFDVSGKSGFEFGAGVRGELYDLDGIKLVGYTQLAYISDDFGKNITPGNVGDIFKYSASGFELSGGVLSLHEVNDNLSLYGGLELIPFSTMKVEFEYDEWDSFGSIQGKDSYDMERDSIFGLRIGAKYIIDDGVFVRGEFGLMGEKSFTIGAGATF